MQYLVELSKRPFFYGREYFVLRSGRAQLIIQADKADIGPAFSYMLFDAQNSAQSARKENALNFTPSEGFVSSALEVELGGYPFTALGHRTETGWVSQGGAPAVRAVWWAGGVQIVEQVMALVTANAFQRTIQLSGAHLVGTEQIYLRLGLPAGAIGHRGKYLIWDSRKIRMAITNHSEYLTRITEDKARLVVGPVTVEPNAQITIQTLLFTQLPAGDKRDLLNHMDALSLDSLQAETRAYWDMSSRIHTNDVTVQQIYDKARYGLPAMIADDGTMNAGIFEYGGQWVRDTSCTVLGALHCGHFEVARSTLVHVLSHMIAANGATMIAGSYDQPDREQFDQMGELMHVLKAYRDWTGDDELIREHREQVLALIERPLRPEFRDDSGMLHNRREFWERAFEDAYELAYQIYVVQGLRDAIPLASLLRAEDRVERWRQEADRILHATLMHPTRALVDQGHLIKRRNVTGELADRNPVFPGHQPDVPLATEAHHRLFPDTSEALPIMLGLIDPKSELALRTLDDLEQLWNTRWSDGGYDRYHTSSQPDQPGPWPFATCFVLRAQHEAGLYERSRRCLEWLNTVQGGRTGAWLEEIPSVRSNTAACGILPWISGEIAVFVVRHLLGVRFDESGLVLKPALFPGSPSIHADLRYRQDRLRLDLEWVRNAVRAWVNGREIATGGTAVS